MFCRICQFDVFREGVRSLPQTWCWWLVKPDATIQGQGSTSVSGAAVWQLSCGWQSEVLLNKYHLDAFTQLGPSLLNMVSPWLTGGKCLA